MRLRCRPLRSSANSSSAWPITCRSSWPTCGPDRRFKFVNKANADRFGVTPAQMVGRRVDEFLGPELTKEIEPYINRVLAGERVEYEMTYSFPATGQPAHAVHVRPRA